MQRDSCRDGTSAVEVPWSDSTRGAIRARGVLRAEFAAAVTTGPVSFFAGKEPAIGGIKSNRQRIGYLCGDTDT
jgi:hypothetical protein